MYSNKLNNIVDEFNNTYYRTIKVKLIDVKSVLYALMYKIIKKILNLKSVIISIKI